MKPTEILHRLQVMSDNMNAGIAPIPSEGNVKALRKGVEMIERAILLTLLPPQPEVRHEVASTFSSNGRVAGVDFGYPTDADKIDPRAFLALSGTKGSMSPATKLCTRKHNCFASPEPCNGPQRPKVAVNSDTESIRNIPAVEWDGRVLVTCNEDIRDLHNHAR